MYIKSFETELLKSIDKDIFTAQEHPYIIEKEYLVEGFDWDDLMIQKQQIETPEWSTEELKSLVEWERFKTTLWFLLFSPIMNKIKIIKRIFSKPLNAYYFIKYVLSSVITRVTKRFRSAT